MARNFRRTHIDGQPLHPSTQMTAFGYDPSLSEGAVKPPVFLTSTFAFASAEEGADFFDVVAGRKPAPEGMGAGGLVYSRFNHPNLEIVEDRLAIYDHAEKALVTSSGMMRICTGQPVGGPRNRRSTLPRTSGKSCARIVRSLVISRSRAGSSLAMIRSWA